MKTKNLLLFLLAPISFLFASCVKDDTVSLEEQCNKLSQLRANPIAAVNKGDEIVLTADTLEGASYYWTGPNYFQSYYQNNTITSDANYYDRGWYHVKISYDDCNESVFDSVYVAVNFPQGTPSCSLTNNSADFTSALFLGDQSFSFINFGAVTGGYGVTANSANGDMRITMSDYWNTHDLEDGVYVTSSNPIPEYADIDQVFISDVNQGIYWVAQPDKPVYISHVGGKQRISFCGIQFSGDNGSNFYTANVDAQLTQP